MIGVCWVRLMGERVLVCRDGGALCILCVWIVCDGSKCSLWMMWLGGGMDRLMYVCVWGGYLVASVWKDGVCFVAGMGGWEFNGVWWWE